MQPKKNKKFDRLEIGLIVGFLIPVLIFFAVFYFSESTVSFRSYVKSLWHLQTLIKVGSLCVFTNTAAFWGFLKIKYEKAARGVLGATIIYAIFIFIAKAL
jgi:hypothetical protein